MSVERSELNVERSAPRGAVFLSYAREDTAAARRIADALRSQDIEVWFDQNELRGGEAWDAKIRHQIQKCALFLPVISAATQERHEGYFRREWKVAVNRTHDMAAGVAFIVPVVIDDTTEQAAAVPEEFMHVQWTRMPGALPTPQFVDQVKRLLVGRPWTGQRKGDPVLSAPGAAAVGRPVPEQTPGRKAPIFPGRRRSDFPRRAGALMAGVAIIGAIVAWLVMRPEASSAKNQLGSGTSQPTPAKEGVQPGNAPALSTKSIAVLPFANFSPDKDNEFFADGMHDEVITALAKIHDLKVISRTSVMAYKNPEGRNLKKIATELGVANILEGSVQRAGNRVRVIVQLIDARTDQHLWAETYTEDLTDVFTIQSKLAGAITTALKATLSPEENSLIARRPTENQEAYDLYLRARALGETSGDSARTRESLDRIGALYEQAIAKDPAFTLAYVQLCATHGVQYWFGYLDPTPARKARAKAALDAAVRLAPEAPETHLARGIYAYTCDNDWARALAEYRVAEAGLPNDAQLAYYIGIAQRRLGRRTEALASFARSVELNPRDETVPTQQVGTILALRRYPEARSLTAHYATLFPENPSLLFCLASARLELEGDRAAYLRSLETNPAMGNDPYGLMKAYRLALARGDFAAADQALADPRLIQAPAPLGVINDPVPLLRAYVALLRGQTAAAHAYAEEAMAAFRVMPMVPRQEAWIMIHTAKAQALAGRADEAVRLAREGNALESHRDAFDAVMQYSDVAEVYLILDRRDDALAELRKMMTGPCLLGPEQVRLDPLWSRLKDDPRFEEILKTAKPL